MLTTKPPLDVLRNLDPARFADDALDQVPPMPAGVFADAVDPEPRPHRLQRRTLIAGVTAVTLAAAIAIPTFTGSGTETASAAQVLQNVADVAGRQAAALPRDDQFFYVRSTVAGYVVSAEANSPDPPKAVSSVREAWTSATRPGRLLTTPTSGTPLMTPNNGAVGSLSATRGLQIGSERLSTKDIASYPTDPQAIHRRLVAGVQGRGQSTNAQAFDDIKTALAEQPVPGDLRSSLYRTLALVPGITVDKTTTEDDGRPGTTIALETNGIRDELTFDPETAELLATKTTITSPDQAEVNLPTNTTLNSVTYDRRAVTPTTERP